MMFDEMGDSEQIQFWIEAVGKEKFQEGKAEVIRAMLREGTDDPYILKVTGVTPEYLTSLKKQLSEKNRIIKVSHVIRHGIYYTI